MKRESLCHLILSTLAESGVDVQVLHGVSRGGSVGRDVDVWIAKQQWEFVFTVLFSLSRDHGIDMVRINSPFGLRFLFFEKVPSTCGFLEFHCVRSLNWFWVGNPALLQAAPPYKRFILPLLSGDISKLEQSRQSEPLTLDEERALREDFRVRNLLNDHEGNQFFDLFDQGDFYAASRHLRSCVLRRTFLHPLRLAHFFLRRAILPIWLFRKPCGIALFSESESVPDMEALRSRKGVLTDVCTICVADMPLPHIIAALPRWIVSQGRQKATVFVVSGRTKWIGRLFREPVFLDTASDPVPAMDMALQRMISETNRQVPHCAKQRTVQWRPGK